jgi:hypothetical protein
MTKKLLRSCAAPAPNYYSATDIHSDGSNEMVSSATGKPKESSKSPGMGKRASSYPGRHAVTAGEKKRNKLGYHRTGVACGKAPVADLGE